jgi:hypothetical protein
MVTAQGVALFIHLLGVITLFIAIGLLQRGGARLRASSTVEEMRLWLGLVQTTRRMFPAALLLILLSGLYMTDQSWTFDTPWIIVAIVSVVIMGALGGAVVGRGFAAIGRATSGTGSASPDGARAYEPGAVDCRHRSERHRARSTVADGHQAGMDAFHHGGGSAGGDRRRRGFCAGSAPWIKSLLAGRLSLWTLKHSGRRSSLPEELIRKRWRMPHN